MALFVGRSDTRSTAGTVLFIEKDPELFWGVVASMYIGNVISLCSSAVIGIWSGC